MRASRPGGELKAASARARFQRVLDLPQLIRRCNPWSRLAWKHLKECIVVQAESHESRMAVAVEEHDIAESRVIRVRLRDDDLLPASPACFPKACPVGHERLELAVGLAQIRVRCPPSAGGLRWGTRASERNPN